MPERKIYSHCIILYKTVHFLKDQNPACVSHREGLMSEFCLTAGCQVCADRLVFQWHLPAASAGSCSFRRALERLHMKTERKQKMRNSRVGKKQRRVRRTQMFGWTSVHVCAVEQNRSDKQSGHLIMRKQIIQKLAENSSFTHPNCGPNKGYYSLLLKP